MSWAKVKKINSDMETPLDWQFWIDRIINFGLSDWVLNNSPTIIEMAVKSTVIWENATSAGILYDQANAGWIDEFMLNSKKLSYKINAYADDDVCDGDTIDELIYNGYAKGMPIKFDDGFYRYVYASFGQDTSGGEAVDEVFTILARSSYAGGIADRYDGAYSDWLDFWFGKPSGVGKWMNDTFEMNTPSMNALATVNDVFENEVAMLAIEGSEAAIAAISMSDVASSAIKTSIPLATTSWALIDAFASIYSVGEEKNIVVNGETLTLQVIGKNHDNLTGGGKARLTFGLKNLMAATRAMNGSNTNAGGWGSCAMRTWITGTLIGQLPVELQNVLKPVDKLTSAGSQSATINTTSDKVFLFSEVELFGGVTHSKAGEGSQYPVYTDNASRIKKLSNGSGAANAWWERSPLGSYSTGFCLVLSDGTASNSGAIASNSRGVCWGFCI